MHFQEDQEQSEERGEIPQNSLQREAEFSNTPSVRVNVSLVFQTHPGSPAFLMNMWALELSFPGVQPKAGSLSCVIVRIV